MDNGIKRQQLPEEAQRELEEGAEWLLTAKFEQLEKEPYFYCVETKALVERFGRVLAHFDDGSLGSETRITAIRFDEPATVPVKRGSTVDVIPVFYTSGITTIGGEKLEIGQYVHLTEGAQVEPAFYCLLLLRQVVERGGS